VLYRTEEVNAQLLWRFPKFTLSLLSEHDRTSDRFNECIRRDGKHERRKEGLRRDKYNISKELSTIETAL